MDTLPLWPLFLAATIVFGVAFAAMAIGVMVSGPLPARLLRRAGRDRPGGRAPVLRNLPQPEQGPGDEACVDCADVIGGESLRRPGVSAAAAVTCA